MKRLILFVVLFGVCQVAYSQWVSLTAPTTKAGANFGHAVALGPDFLAVSAPGVV